MAEPGVPQADLSCLSASVSWVFNPVSADGRHEDSGILRISGGVLPDVLYSV